MNELQEQFRALYSMAELLSGSYDAEQCGDIVLPICVLRRFDCMLSPTKDAVLAVWCKPESKGMHNLDRILTAITQHKFYNTSSYDFAKLLAEPENIAANLRDYINGFSENARQVFEQYAFDRQITRLNADNLLYPVLSRLHEVNLCPEAVSREKMNYIFSELIRRFSVHEGQSDRHRKVIEQMVNPLLEGAELTVGDLVAVFDPAYMDS